MDDASTSAARDSRRVKPRAVASPGKILPFVVQAVSTLTPRAGRARSSEEIPVKGVPIKREIARGEPQRLAGPLEARSSPIVPALLEDVCSTGSSEAIA